MSGQIPIGNEYPFALLIPKGRYFEVRTCVSLFSRFALREGRNERQCDIIVCNAT